VNTSPYETIDEALRAMIGKKIDATVADKISLVFHQRQFSKEAPPMRFEIPEFSIRNSFLAIPVRSGHPDYGKINQSLLDLTSSNDWEPLVNRWIGPDHLSQ
jgi:ABC-type amino acid transport substrate-binding protein